MCFIVKVDKKYKFIVRAKDKIEAMTKAGQYYQTKFGRLPEKTSAKIVNCYAFID